MFASMIFSSKANSRQPRRDMATVKADNLDVTPTKPKDDSSKAGSTDIRKVATTTQAAGNNTRKARKPAEKSAWLTKATGNLLKEFDPVALEAGSTEVTSSAGFDLVSTYNWNLGKVPSIYVPGMFHSLQDTRKR